MLAPDAFSEFPQVLKGIYDPLPETYSEGLRDLVVSMLNKDVSKRPTTNDLLQVLAYRASASVCSIAVEPIRPCQSKATRSSHSLPLLAAPCGSHQGTRLSQRPIFRRPGLEHLAHETPAFSFSPGRGFSPGEGRGVSTDRYISQRPVRDPGQAMPIRPQICYIALHCFTQTPRAQSL